MQWAPASCHASALQWAVASCHASVLQWAVAMYHSFAHCRAAASYLLESSLPGSAAAVSAPSGLGVADLILSRWEKCWMDWSEVALQHSQVAVSQSGVLQCMLAGLTAAQSEAPDACQRCGWQSQHWH